MQAACLGFTSSEMLLPTDISFLFPYNTALCSMRSFVCMPDTWNGLDEDIWDIVFHCPLDVSVIFKKCSEPDSVFSSLEDVVD